MKRVFTILFLLAFTICNSQNVKIPLTSDMAHVNQEAKDDINYLLDGNIATRFTLYSPQFTPYRITFDLSDFDNCVPRQLKYYVNNGNTFTVNFFYVRKFDGAKILFFTYTGGSWIQSWVTVDVPTPAVASQFIIESNTAGSDFPEDIELWGTYTKHNYGDQPRRNTNLKNLIGFVGKPWDIDFTRYYDESKPIVESVGNRMRLYNDYTLNHVADTAGAAWSTNGWYQITNAKILKADSIDVQMDYLSVPYQPFDTTKSVRESPSNYVALGQDIYHLCAENKDSGRYFSTIEILNEVNAWYSSNPARDYMNGYAIAAMMSTCYDGNKGQYANCGAKAADDSILVSISGLATVHDDIFYEIYLWTIANRGYKADGTPDYPFDIYSYHNYSSFGGQYSGIPGGVPPEIGMIPFMQQLNDFRKKYAKNIRIHLGEWGWDINSESILNAPAFGSYTAHQVAAMWTVRALLGMAQYEIDASSYYRIQQDYSTGNTQDANPQQFATMALVRRENDGTIQPSQQRTGMGYHRTMEGDYIKQLREFFDSDYLFDAQVSATPIVLRFKKGSTYLYAIYSVETLSGFAQNTRGTITENTGTYTLGINGTKRTFVDDGSGVMASATYNAGDVINYGSKPVLIVTNDPVPRLRFSFNGRIK